MAPRPTLVVSPQLDRDAVLADVTQAVEAARKAFALYGKAERLKQVSPETINQFWPQLTQQLVIDWLNEQSKE